MRAFPGLLILSIIIASFTILLSPTQVYSDRYRLTIDIDLSGLGNGIKGRYAGVIQVIAWTPYRVYSVEKNFTWRTPSLKIDVQLLKYIREWRKYISSHTSLFREYGFSIAPSIAVLARIYTESGDNFMASYVIRQTDLLREKGYRYREAVDTLIRDPLAGFMKKNSVRIELKPSVLGRVGDGINESSLSYSYVFCEPLAGDYSVLRCVYLGDLYSVRDTPPQKWVDRVLYDNGEKPPEDKVRAIWRNIAVTYSSDILLRKDDYSLEDAVQYAVGLGASRELGGGIYYGLHGMSSFINRNRDNNDPGIYVWNDSVSDYIKNINLSLICGNAKYFTDKGDSLVFGLMVAKASFSAILSGFSIYGYMINPREDVSVDITGDMAIVTKQHSYVCIMAPAAIVGLYDAVFVDVNIYSTYVNGAEYWVIHPVLIPMPLYELYIDYGSTYEEEYSNGEPPELGSITWSSIDLTIYNNTLNGSTPVYPSVFFSDTTKSTDASLQYFSGAALAYYVPVLYGYLKAIGMLTGPFDELAEEIINTIADLVGYTLFSAYGSAIFFKIKGYTMEQLDGDVQVTVYKRVLSIKIPEGYRRPFCALYTIYIKSPSDSWAPGTPPPGNGPLTTNRSSVKP